MLALSVQAWMLTNGFDPQHLNGRGKHRDTALILASRKGEIDVVRELIAAGADINLCNMDSTNALWAACVAKCQPIAELLLENGIDLNHQNDNGATVLMYAASSGRSDWVEFLIESGADTRLRSLDGYDALDLASELKILRLLKNFNQQAYAESEIGC